jgi:hypothetical protein
VGLEVLELLRPVPGVHVYDKAPVPPVPAGVAPIVTQEPVHKVASFPAFAVGLGLTVIVMQAEALHPFASVTVTQYVVLVVGNAVGFAMVVLFSPKAGDHE